MNRSFILGAFVFGTGIIIGVALERQKNDNIHNQIDKDTLHGIR